MQAFVPFDRLGGLIPKTITVEPRIGNPPPRTVETSSGMLNSIGLDNDGLEMFIEKHLSYLTSLGTSVIANIAGRTIEEFTEMAKRLDKEEGVAGLELNISCPNVSGGVDYGTNPKMTEELIAAVRASSDLPVIAKLTPNVTSVVEIAEACRKGGADAVSLVNTFQGMAIDWKKQKPILGNVIGGLSGPAIKPLALRCVWQVYSNVDIPIIGIGGISSLDDVMEFLIAGASAVQIGTANFYNPSLAGNLVDSLPTALEQLGAKSVSEIVGSLAPKQQAKC